MSTKKVLHEDPILNEYYLEIDVCVRRKLLDDYINQYPSSNLNDFRAKMLEVRYQNTNDIDKYLWHIINILYVYNFYKSSFLKKSAYKELAKIIEEFGYNQIVVFGDGAEKEFGFEVLNAFIRYMRVTKNDKSYSKKLFGLSSMKEDEVRQKIVNDAYILSTLLPNKFNDIKELKTFSDAVKNALFYEYDDAELLLSRCSRSK